MNTYLFVWNPKYWQWDNLESNIEEVYRLGTYVEDWSCGSTRSIQSGERFFVVKVGTDKRNSVKGIVGSGFVINEPYKKQSVQDPTKEVLHVDLKFDNLLNPYVENVLTLDILQTGTLAAQRWTPQSSGISIRPELVDELEALWFDLLLTTKVRQNPFLEADGGKRYTEGVPNQVTLTVYERNPYARKACLEKHGYSCAVCKFDFEKAYGELGKNFIHVHHLRQIAAIGKSFTIDPVQDLRPVCPNCHAMLHRRKECQ